MASSRQRYQQSEKGRAASRSQDARRAEANLALAESYLDECVDCGNEDCDVLQFDHVYGEKADTVKALAYRSRPKMLAEIEKCEVRCANCHQKRHRRERLWT